VVKVRDGGMVQNKAAHLAVGVDADGFKHALGIWLGGDEGSSFWAGVLAELRNRGVRDVLFGRGDDRGLGKSLGRVHPVPQVRRRYTKGDLYY
jgi:putative transposase